VRGGENNTNNRVEDSLQFHEGLGTNVMVGNFGHEAAEGSFILPSLHLIILPLEPNNNTLGTLGVSLGGNPWEPRLPETTK
jgi:hypothetical protein